MSLRNNTENKTFLFHNTLMENSKEKKILGIVKDDKLNFKSQEVNYVKWLLRKLQLCYLHNSEKKIIFNSMVKSQFIAL